MNSPLLDKSLDFATKMLLLFYDIESIMMVSLRK